jgi:hypothetical protein
MRASMVNYLSKRYQRDKIVFVEIACGFLNTLSRNPYFLQLCETHFSVIFNFQVCLSATTASNFLKRVSTGQVIKRLHLPSIPTPDRRHRRLSSITIRNLSPEP